MKYFITGASSFIGNNVIRIILANDREAQIEALMPKRDADSLYGLKIKKIFGNISVPESYVDSLDSETIVIHMSHLHNYRETKEELLLINYEATRCLTDMCIMKKVKKFVYVSTTEAIYKGADVITEPARFYPEKLDNNFAMSKALSAYYVNQKIQTTRDFNACIVYPTVMVGPNDYKPTSIGTIIQDAVLNARQPAIKGSTDFVDVRDVADIIYKLTGNNVRGAFILSGIQLKFDDFNEIVAAYAANGRKFKYVSGISRKSTPPYKMMAKQVFDVLSENVKYSSSNATQLLEYKPRAITETIRDAVQFFQKLEKE